MVENRRISGKKEAKASQKKAGDGPISSSARVDYNSNSLDKRPADEQRDAGSGGRPGWVEIGNLVVLVMTFIAGAALTVKTSDLVTATNTAIEEARGNASRQAEDTQAALRLAGDQADAAANQASAMRAQLDQVQSTERPYVYVSNLRWNAGNAADDPRPKVDYGFINVGRNPTVVRQISIDCLLVSLPLPPAPDFKVEKEMQLENAMQAGAALQSGNEDLGVRSCQPDSALTANDYADLRAGTKVFMVWGYVNYDGIFGESYARRFASIWGAYAHPPDNIFHDVLIPTYNGETETPPAKQ
jgi:hypothetical protein